jgi:hypothetical protein
MALLTVEERSLLHTKMQEGEKKIRDFLLDRKNNSYQERLKVFLMTPGKYYTFTESVPRLITFETDYGYLNWNKEFGYSTNNAVDVAELCRLMISGDHFKVKAKSWTESMVNAFVKDCVNNAVHEFEYTI